MSKQTAEGLDALIHLLSRSITKYFYNHISWIYGYYYGLSFVVWGNIAVDGVEFLGWAPQQQLLGGEDKRCSTAPWHPLSWLHIIFGDVKMESGDIKKPRLSLCLASASELRSCAV